MSREEAMRELNTHWFGKTPQPYIFLQWKGTNACFDFWCVCGQWGHFDGEFASVLRCPSCNRYYETPFHLPLRAIDPTEAEAKYAKDMTMMEPQDA